MSIPSKASVSTAGEILLGGDLTGTGVLPTLADSGVVAGTYKLTKASSVDSKGRLTSIGAMTQAEIDAEINAAYATSPSSFTIVNGKPVLLFPTASAGVPGLFQFGTGFDTSTPGVAQLKTSDASNLGLFKIGNGLKIVGDTAQVDSTSLVLSSGGVVNARVVNSIAATSISGVGGLTFQFEDGTTYVPSSSSESRYQVPHNDAYNFVADFTDGITIYGGPDYNYFVCASNGTTFLGVQRSQNGDFLQYSTTDGGIWTTKPFPGLVDFPLKWSVPVGLASNGTDFVLVASHYATSSSANPQLTTFKSSDSGATWTSSTNTSIIASFSSRASNLGFSRSLGVTYGGGRYLIVTTAGQSYYSTDGLTWTAGGSMTSSGGIPSIRWCGSAFVCVFINGAYSTTFIPSIFYSTDGVTWTSKDASFPATRGFSDFATNGSGTVVVTVQTSATATAMYYSTNSGNTWASGGNVSGNPQCHLIRYNNSRFEVSEAAGTFRLIYSTTGTGTWTAIAQATWGPNFKTYTRLSNTGVFQYNCQLKPVATASTIFFVGEGNNYYYVYISNNGGVSMTTPPRQPHSELTLAEDSVPTFTSGLVSRFTLSNASTNRKILFNVLGYYYTTLKSGTTDNRFEVDVDATIPITIVYAANNQRLVFKD